ncbi:MAG: DUF58 domain-containing protein [Verrucomicrobia bacterium]|nr:DUF58 domain-containing protein [Verrucomicrobiota bacterium]
MRDALQYLDPKVIARIQNLELLARVVVEGFLVGLHKSPFHGFSVEFSSYRPYMKGDDTRYIDWKLWGRTDELFLKLFVEETNLRAHILLDTSASMGYAPQAGGDNAVSKYKYGVYLGAALAYLMMLQKDAVGVATFDTEIRHYLPPRARLDHLLHVLKILDRVKVAEQTGFARGLDALAERIRKRGMIIVISDLFDEPEAVMDVLKHFRHAGHEVLVFQVLTRDEVELPFTGQILFEDLETGERLTTLPASVQDKYKEVFSAHQRWIAKECANSQIDFVPVVTDESLGIALMQYLIKRRKSH